MRHKLLPVFAGHVTICTPGLVGEGDPVHHCDSGVPEASMLVRSLELYPYVQSAFEQKTQLVKQAEQNSNGRHGLMYFDIVLCYQLLEKI